ncbi:MAG: FliA/WhiG family RNA polymerase sigma factor [SAR324 cluster bacterium]|nr:FliA/WhiG family RNA polymerase sigma factor [SAR324 cluster bacterium]
MNPNPYAQQAQKSREDLVLENAHLIKRIVSRMSARLPSEVDKDELYQAGSLGLLDAVDKFDPGKEVQFKTYAEFRIKGAIIDELRSMDWIPRSVRSAATQMEHAHTTLTNTLGREPSDAEMAHELDMSTKEYYQFLAKSRPIPLVSLSNYGKAGDEDSQDMLEVIEDPDVEDPFATFSSGEMQQKLAGAIKTLPEQEQLILSLYYMEEMNLKEIGEVLGVSESRVSQIRTKVIVKLRVAMKSVMDQK